MSVSMLLRAPSAPPRLFRHAYTLKRMRSGIVVRVRDKQGMGGGERERGCWDRGREVVPLNR